MRPVSCGGAVPPSGLPELPPSEAPPPPGAPPQPGSPPPALLVPREPPLEPQPIPIAATAPPSPFKKRRRESLMSWIQELPEKEKTVVILRFGLDGGEAHTLEEIGQTLGLTRERVRQIETAALVKLRATIERKTMTQEDLL